MMLTRTQRWRKQNREENKEIEKKLHPNHVAKEGIEIVHYHRTNGEIMFCAWDMVNDRRLNCRAIMIPRINVYASVGDFYKEYMKDDILWLIEGA